MRFLFISNAGYFAFGDTLLEACKTAKVGSAKQSGRYIAFNPEYVDLRCYGAGVGVKSLKDNVESLHVHSYMNTVYGEFKIFKGEVVVTIQSVE